MKIQIFLVMGLHLFLLPEAFGLPNNINCKKLYESLVPRKELPQTGMCTSLKTSIDQQIDNLTNAIQKAYPPSTRPATFSERHSLSDEYVKAMYKAVKVAGGGYTKENLDMYKKHLAGLDASYQQSLDQLKNFDQNKNNWETQILPLENKSKEIHTKYSQVVLEKFNLANSGSYDPKEMEALEQKLYNYQGEIQAIYAEISKITNGSQGNTQALNNGVFFIPINYSLSKSANEQNIKLQYENAAQSAKTMIAEIEKNLTTNEEGPSEESLKQYKQELLSEIKYRRNSSTFKDCGFTNEEVHAIMFYTSNGYSAINRALWEKDQKKLAQYKVIIQRLNSGLAKIAPFEGTVRRGASLPDEVIKQYCKGCIVKVDPFISTSTASGFGGQHRFIIKSKSGSYIAPISSVSHEEEVLFQSGTRFKVVDVKDNEYTLVEIEPK